MTTRKVLRSLHGQRMVTWPSPSLHQAGRSSILSTTVTRPASHGIRSWPRTAPAISETAASARHTVRNGRQIIDDNRSSAATRCGSSTRGTRRSRPSHIKSNSCAPAYSPPACPCQYPQHGPLAVGLIASLLRATEYMGEHSIIDQELARGTE